MLKFIGKYQILLLSILGSLVRLIYGIIYEPWVDAPDHVAWEFLVEQGSWRYDHLIHYPHEGGTILLTVLSRFFGIFTEFSSLAISAFVLDFVVRYIQIGVVKKVINQRTATLFGLWSIFATATILPWGMVNFGLHSISSVFPFLLLLLINNSKSEPRNYLWQGAFLGLAIWFSYTNIVLIPIYFLYQLISRNSIRAWGYAVISFIGVLGLHSLVRIYSDPGFHLTDFGIMSIRGEDFSLNDVDLWGRISNLPSVTANSMIALPHTSYGIDIARWTVYTLLLLALIGIVLAYKSEKHRKFFLSIFGIIGVFLILYSLSPFFNEAEVGHYVMFRHFTYILPAISLLIVFGLNSFKLRFLVYVFVILSAFRCVQVFNAPNHPPNDMTIKASGWVLATKLGHDPDAVVEVITNNNDQQNLLIEGVGWGITTALMQESDSLSKPELDSKVAELITLLKSYPESYQSRLHDGLKLAYSAQVTPRLNPEILELIENGLYNHN